MTTIKVMFEDFYCEQVLNGKIEVKKVQETDEILAYYHTKPFWELHIVVIPKQHIPSFLSFDQDNEKIIVELLKVVRDVAECVTEKYGAARILTNLGNYQDSKHLHFHINFGNPIK